ncbi:MAG: glycosyltransferase N-terminal domain-containing protein [Thermodesulfobacteriota bacterium]
MSLLYTAYTVFSSGLLITCFPPFYGYAALSGRFREGLGERLGLAPGRLPRDAEDAPRIWLQAASLGEVRVAGALRPHLEKAVPGCTIFLSTTTPHGREMGRKIFGNRPVFYAPIDTLFSVRKALSRVRPDVLVMLETEIWPAWITEAHRMGIPIALVNGRISVRSVGKYLRLRPFFRDVLSRVEAFSMIGREDAERILAMGAKPEKVRIGGNAKYELLAGEADPAAPAEIRRALNLGPSQPVLVAGSTRSGEEDMILDAFRRISSRFPDAVLILAPRHVARTRQIESLLRDRGFSYRLRTDLSDPSPKRTEPVVLVNTFGELFRLYSVGTINFCGASLVPLGGQNPLEPAAWGKAAFYGPSMDDFLDAKDLLEGVGAGIEIQTPAELADRAVWFLEHPEDLRARGESARNALLQDKGAAEKHAKVITGLLEGH